jgi:hypothetical protein
MDDAPLGLVAAAAWCVGNEKQADYLAFSVLISIKHSFNTVDDNPWPFLLSLRALYQIILLEEPSN